MPKVPTTDSKEKLLLASFDTNENKLIEENEFIDLFKRPRALA